MGRNRKERLGKADLFGGSDPDPLLEADAALYGNEAFAQVDSQRYIAEPLSIFRIWPDLKQPRRAMPSSVRSIWNGSPNGLMPVFDLWIAKAEEERGEKIDMIALITAEEDVERHPEPGPVEGALMKLVELAASIRHEGLTNPVTVVRDGTEYRLETGERRWLAFHMLHGLLEDDRWNRMPARIVDEMDVWRQASENNVRKDLNAIGRARQFAILLMSLYDVDEFQPYNDLVEPEGSDRPYYGQVANGSDWRIPRGKRELMINAMGLKHVNQLGYYRALLRLPDIVWQLADDLNWTENFIRDLRAEANDDDELVRAAVKQALASRWTTTVDLSVDIPNEVIRDIDPPPPPSNPSVKRGKRIAKPEVRRYLRSLGNVRTGVGEASEAEKNEVLEEINHVRQWLDELEKTLKASM